MSKKIQREIKSSLFIDYFGINEVVGKQNFLELYNAIHDTHYTLENCELKLRLIDDTRVLCILQWKHRLTICKQV